MLDEDNSLTFDCIRTLVRTQNVYEKKSVGAFEGNFISLNDATVAIQEKTLQSPEKKRGRM